MDTKLKKKFEANMLDGDKVEDCGGSMLSAESVWSFIHSAVEDTRKEIKEKIKGMKKRINKKYSTDERRYPHGYNQALQDVIDLLSHKKETKNEI